MIPRTLKFNNINICKSWLYLRLKTTNIVFKLRSHITLVLCIFDLIAKIIYYLMY